MYTIEVYMYTVYSMWITRGRVCAYMWLCMWKAYSIPIRTISMVQVIQSSETIANQRRRRLSPTNSNQPPPLIDPFLQVLDCKMFQDWFPFWIAPKEGFIMFEGGVQFFFRNSFWSGCTLSLKNPNKMLHSKESKRAVQIQRLELCLISQGSCTRSLQHEDITLRDQDIDVRCGAAWCFRKWLKYIEVCLFCFSLLLSLSLSHAPCGTDCSTHAS